MDSHSLCLSSLPCISSIVDENASGLVLLMWYREDTSDTCLICVAWTGVLSFPIFPFLWLCLYIVGPGLGRGRL